MLITALGAIQDHFVQVQHLNFADVCGASKLVKVSVAHNYETGGASALVERRQLVPLVFLDVINLTGPSAALNVPRADHNEIPLPPADHAVSVTSVIHVSKAAHEAPGFFVKHCRCFKVSFSASNGSSRHINFPSDFN